MKSDFTLLSITREKWNFHELFYGFVLYSLPFFNFTLKKRQVRFKGILDILLV